MVNSDRGQVVLITGGSRGIGEGIARAFVSAGAAVVICGRDSKTGEAAAGEMNGAGPGTCRFTRCDVSKSEDNERLIRTTVEDMGRLDCLINNAGWHPPYVPIDEFSVAEFVQLLRLNLVSYFELSRLALPALRLSGGSIINVGSLVGTIGQEGATMYCATKGGIDGLTRALAVDEARHGVRVNAVLPGAIETPLYREYLDGQADPEEAERLVARWQWMGRVGQPAEVGAVCVFLASEAASFVTGVGIPISGGAELAYGYKWI